MLIALGLQLSADGVTPESLLPFPRWSALALCAFVPLGLLYLSGIETVKGHVRANLMRGDFEAAAEGAEAKEAPKK